MKKAAIALSVGLNLLTLAFIVAAYVAVSSGYFIKLFIEPAHARWVSQFEILPVESKDTVFLGDSITEGGSWHELFPETSVRNRGIGGDVTEGVLARLSQVSAGQPQQVFLLIGTNDLGFDIEEDVIVSNIQRIVDEIRMVSPETEIYVQSVLPRSEDYRERIESLNLSLSKVISEHAQWVDLYPSFLATDGSIRDDYSNDELHLNGSGYLAWQGLIKHLVNESSSLERSKTSQTLRLERVNTKG